VKTTCELFAMAPCTRVCSVVMPLYRRLLHTIILKGRWATQTSSKKNAHECFGQWAYFVACRWCTCLGSTSAIQVIPHTKRVSDKDRTRQELERSYNTCRGTGATSRGQPRSELFLEADLEANLEANKFVALHLEANFFSFGRGQRWQECWQRK